MDKAEQLNLNHHEENRRAWAGTLAAIALGATVGLTLAGPSIASEVVVGGGATVGAKYLLNRRGPFSWK